MTARAPTPPAAPRLLVTLSETDLRTLVRDTVQEIVDEVARPAPPALLGTQEIAVQIGVSEPTVRKLRDQGMPFIDVGDRAYRYELTRCLEWLRRRNGGAQ